MSQSHRPKIGVTCAYAPLALIDAAGCTPVRLLPMGDWPDQAGQLLHDNLCPHVKRILDGVMAHAHEDLAGTVVVNCCDAMRRLSDAWRDYVPDQPVILLDLPMTGDARAADFLAGEYRHLAKRLEDWGGRPFSEEQLNASMSDHQEVVRLLEILRLRQARGALRGGVVRLQELTNFSMTHAFSESISRLQQIVAQPDDEIETEGIPVYLFGNVLPDPEAFDLLVSCGIHIVGDDLCTGRRCLQPIKTSEDRDPFASLAQGILAQDPCARMMDAPNPYPLGKTVASRAQACGAKGVIAHVAKFCDPYLARLPFIKDALDKEGLPSMVLEGDCALRSLGQQKTRIEAFAEMLR